MENRRLLNGSLQFIRTVLGSSTPDSISADFARSGVHVPPENIDVPKGRFGSASDTCAYRTYGQGRTRFIHSSVEVVSGSYPTVLYSSLESRVQVEKFNHRLLIQPSPGG